MNALRSVLTSLVRPTNATALPWTTSVRTVTQKPPSKRPDLKKPVVPIAPSFIPYNERPRTGKPWGSKGCKRMHTKQPHVDWIRDYDIPREHILSSQPRFNHHYHDFRQLKDARKRAYVHRWGRIRSSLRQLYRTNLLPAEFRQYVQQDINKLPRDSTYMCTVDRCVVTSRPRAVLGRWRVSRMIWRNYADHNQLSGVMRAKWGKKFDDVYWHHIDPDLRGTLRAVDPLYGDQVANDYHRWEDEWYSGSATKLMKYDGAPIVYNQNIFKEPFVYPPKLT
ncbi:hypothetical protein RvY_16761 [Ramazzottius varieornatus]|uniref:Uncharacterized protein n=1 Tax=Ramazzottius varieornatus TaxID=947166 RepID=A0A1D1VZN5_RAMVA|nr:hypothetical protein RvY_16761 [Ramazzottius varieornatus]